MHKELLYRDAEAQIYAVTKNEHNVIANMASLSCILDQTFENFFWVGRADEAGNGNGPAVNWDLRGD